MALGKTSHGLGFVVKPLVKFRVTGFTIVSVDSEEGEIVLNRRAKAVHSVRG